MSVMQSMRTYHLSRCLITLLLISISFLKDIFNQGFEARFPLPLQLSPQLCLGYLTSTVTNVQYKCTVQVYTVHPASAVITPVTSRISDIANPSIRRHNIGQKFTLAPRAPLTPLFPMCCKIVSAQMSAEFY